MYLSHGYKRNKQLSYDQINPDNLSSDRKAVTFKKPLEETLDINGICTHKPYLIKE